ncbi:EAL domain-containing protein [Silvimonas sp. JCM 19000]
MSSDQAPASADDTLHLLDDSHAVPAVNPAAAWPVLIIDDDEEVHAATRFALEGLTLQGRRLELVHGHSAAEARALLATRQDFAVILLDVVMETGDAGLTLVQHIRNTLGLLECRIILRTGQPGYAPELDVFTDYDINDYRTKSELTRTRLITAMIAALRSYQQLRAIAENRRGLELIVHAVADLMEQPALNRFAEGVLTQMTALLNLPVDGIVCAQRGAPSGEPDHEGLYIVGAAGRLAPLIAAPLTELHDGAVRLAIEQAILSRSHQFGPHTTTLYLSGAGQEGAVFIHTGVPLSASDQQLVAVFAANLSACFGNIKQLERLNFAAYHDGLTHLSNRAHFVHTLDAALERRVHGQRAALIDLEHFSDVNDGLGQEVGNALLLTVARRLEASFGAHCDISRIGADVFGLVGPQAELAPERIYSVMEDPFEVGEHTLPVGMALGLCDLEDAGGSGYSALRRATIALNRAKQSVTDSSVRFTPEMEDNTRWRLDVIRALRNDFRAGKLAVWYQPQLSLATGRPCGMEALLRWPGEGSGFVQPPSVFVPLAEYSGLIVEIGEWVLQQAGEAWRAVSAVESGITHIAVNVSIPQFRNGKLAETIAGILGAQRMPPYALELEITESVAMDEPRRVISALKTLREMGVRVAIDDFGTGYSSLGQLQALPIDSLKIDRSFVADIANGRGGSFVETIVALAQKTGLETIAEGVETAEQAGFLRALGCTEAQGFYYAKPMPLDEVLGWLKTFPPRG